MFEKNMKVGIHAQSKSHYMINTHDLSGLFVLRVSKGKRKGREGKAREKKEGRGQESRGRDGMDGKTRPG